MAAYEFKIHYETEAMRPQDLALLMSSLSLIHDAAREDLDLKSVQGAFTRSRVDRELVIDDIAKGSIVGRIMDWIFGSGFAKEVYRESEALADTLRLVPSLSNTTEDQTVERFLEKARISGDATLQRQIATTGIRQLRVAKERLEITSTSVILVDA